VLDRRNHHLFQPLLYQVATAALSPGDIASPIRWILRRQANVQVLLGEARAIDPARKIVTADIGELRYDFLIVASGATHAYFGRDDWRPFAPGLKTLDDALQIRNRVLMAFERAEREDDPREQARLLTFAIIGGGPTGVELAGALAEIARHTLARDFRRIRPERARVVLIEAGPAILPAFPETLRQAAVRSLERLGVEVRLNTRVTDLAEGVVSLGPERLDAGTTIWAAGVAASPLGRSLGAPVDRAGRVLVEPTLAVPGHPEVFVVGDLAALEQDGRLLPGVAPVAIQEAEHAAANIKGALEGRAPLAFRYRDPGNMATIGRAAAVADFGRLQLTGIAAWLAWLFVHILNLIGFRNRVLVMAQWAWAYATYQRNVRLITGMGERA
jgi:NADH dehydrogenase